MTYQLPSMVRHRDTDSQLEFTIQSALTTSAPPQTTQTLLRLSELQKLVKTIHSTEELIKIRLGHRFYLGCKDLMIVIGIVRGNACDECYDRKYVCIEGSYCLRCLSDNDENSPPVMIR